MKRTADPASVQAEKKKPKLDKPKTQKNQRPPQNAKNGAEASSKFDKAKPRKDGVKKPFKAPFKPGKKPEVTQKPPDWAKLKKEKKAVRSARREAGVDAELLAIISKAKGISEKLRRKKLSAADKSRLTDELHALLKAKDHYKQLVLAHDTARIIQWLVKFASDKVRSEAAEALRGAVVPMLRSKYARHIVKRILKYGSAETRNAVLQELGGNVVNLASHSLSSAILDYAYSEIASKRQKWHFQQEFYGDIYKTTKDDNVKSLADTYKTSPEMKPAMLSATKANLLRVLNKNVHDCSLVHAVLFEYITECNSADRSEIITTITPMVAPLSNSKAGVNTAIMCLWHGTNKDKKMILKVLKEQGPSLAVHEHGHLLVLAALASVDDTVLVNKLLLSTLLKDVKSLAGDEWGRKVVLWLVAHNDKTYFHPTFLEWLGEGLARSTAKKVPEARAAELLKEALPQLCASVQEDLEFWFSSGNLMVTAVAIVKSATGEHLKTTLDAISNYICQTSWKVQNEGDEVSGIEHPAIHLPLKKLAQHDKVNAEKSEYTFGESVCKFLSTETVDFWITTNRGCFLLVALLENNSAEVQKQLKEVLNPSMKKIKKQSTKGAQILQNKMVQ